MHMMHYGCVCDSHKLRIYFMQYALSFASKNKKTIFVVDNSITKTSLCNILRFFKAVKMIIFRRKIVTFFLFLLKTLTVATR